MDDRFRRRRAEALVRQWLRDTKGGTSRPSSRKDPDRVQKALDVTRERDQRDNDVTRGIDGGCRMCLHHDTGDVMPLPPNPPTRTTMSDAERRMRDRIISRWMDKHAVYSDEILKGVTEGDTVRWTYWGHRAREDKWCYTTERMFDGKFWSFRYRWVATRGQYELVRSSVRRHARRKDAKDRSGKASGQIV